MDCGRWAVGALALLVLVGAPAARPASAQSPLAALGLTPEQLARVITSAPGQDVAPDPPRTFGISSETAQVVSAADFIALDSTMTWTYVLNEDPATGRSVRRTNNISLWMAGLRLPAGAVVTRLEIAGCDNDATSALLFQLFRSNLPIGTGLVPLTPIGSTGTPATPGCGRFSVTPSSPPLVIDNTSGTYWVLVDTDSTAFDSVRVYYQLQVSVAPATATFGDVPTAHPFFQFVEALVASGITAGCGGGNYCPDAPLTRGQMAAFLAKGLGLHFAP
jgi:hypothetical protein